MGVLVEICFHVHIISYMSIVGLYSIIKKTNSCDKMFGKNDKEIKSEQSSPIPKKFLIVCLIGLILFTGGLTLAMGSHLLKDSRSNYSYTSYESTEQSVMVRTIGMMMAGVGTVVAIAGFLSASFLSEKIDRHTRVALLGSGVGLLFVLLFMTLIFGLT